MLRLSAVAVLAGALSLTSSATAAPNLKSLARQMVATGAPGALVYVRDRDGVHAAAAGYSDLRRKRKMSPVVSFRVGSITKTFVAAVVLELAGERKLSLEDTVERWLPGAIPNGREVTLRQLLSHTSGVPNYTEDRAFLDRAFRNPLRVWTPAELVQVAARETPLFMPGDRFSYSNTNYILLGLVVEAATGTPVAEQLRLRIFEPLALTHTIFPSAAALPAPFTRGYMLPGNGFIAVSGKRPRDVTSWHPSLFWAAGAVVSTADDLARFYSALLGGRLLAPELLAQMERTRTIVLGDGYGLGLEDTTSTCGDAWGHSGSVPGYTTVVWATRDGSRVAVAAENTTPFRENQGLAFGRAVNTAYCG
jgi:D-alanyl-D-alanine carboxypeptidase